MHSQILIFYQLFGVVLDRALLSGTPWSHGHDDHGGHGHFFYFFTGINFLRISRTGMLTMVNLGQPPSLPMGNHAFLQSQKF